MWYGRTDAEKAKILMAAGAAGLFICRVLLLTIDSEMLTSVSLIVRGPSIVLFCYGVGRFAVSMGRSPAWGFAGPVGFLLLYYRLKPKPPAADPLQGRRLPPPPPGYVPTR